MKFEKSIAVIKAGAADMIVKDFCYHSKPGGYNGATGILKLRNTHLVAVTLFMVAARALERSGSDKTWLSWSHIFIKLLDSIEIW